MKKKKIDKKIKTHGILIRSNSKNTLETLVEEIKIDGFTIIKSHLSKKEINKIRMLVDQIYIQQCNEVGGEKVLKSINDANIARATAGYNDIFIKVATLNSIKKICKRILGNVYILNSQNGIINKTGKIHYQYTWHRDLNYQHYVSSRPLALSFLLCIDKFNEKTGGTYVLRGSHKFEKFPSTKYVKKNQEVITAEIGDLIVMDSMIFHRAGKNYSNMTRRGLNHIFTVPIIRQSISFAKMLGIRKDIKNKDTRMILGYNYDHEPSASPKLWRKNKIL